MRYRDTDVPEPPTTVALTSHLSPLPSHLSPLYPAKQNGLALNDDARLSACGIRDKDTLLLVGPHALPEQHNSMPAREHLPPRVPTPVSSPPPEAPRPVASAPVPTAPTASPFFTIFCDAFTVRTGGAGPKIDVQTITLPGCTRISTVLDVKASLPPSP